MAAKRMKGIDDVVVADGQQEAERPSSPPLPSPAERERTGKPCAVCKAELSIIRINVDGNDLLMESCDVCDVRRWQLAGERIDLQDALDHVGEHAGRRR